MTATEQLVIVEQLVLQERKIVTYGWLSRYLNIHANKAKQLLYEFISEHKSSKENNVHAIYCICGLTTDNKQHTVTLVTQEKLEVARKGFTRLTSLHVYSVQPVCPTEAELIKAGREPIDKVANESDLNTYKDASTVTSTLVSQSIDVKEQPEKVDEKKLVKSKSTSSEKSTPITMAIKNTSSQASDKTSDIDSLLNKASSQDESEVSNKKEKKRKSVEVESNHSEDFGGSKEEQSNKKSKKQITGKQKDDKTNDITSLLNKAAFHKELKASNKKSKKRKSDESINELDFEISEEGKAANKQKNGKESPQNKANSQNKVTTKDKVVKKRKNKVADDLDQQEVEASKINERKDGIASLLNKVDKTEQQLEINDKLDKLDINNDKKDQLQDKPSIALVQSTPLTALQKKRGRRQILKSRSYVNERGYTVHENYHEWESFSEGESVSEKKPQKVNKAEEPNITAKRGKKKKGDNGSQKSLLNFFGRK
jgi:DNA polymerase delta subunit 3